MARSFYSWTRYANQGVGSVTADSRYDTDYLKFCRGVYGFQFNLGLDEDNPADSKNYYDLVVTPDDVDYDGPDLPSAVSSFPVIREVIRRTIMGPPTAWGDYEIFINVENGPSAGWLDIDSPSYNNQYLACQHINNIREDVIDITGRIPQFNYTTTWHLGLNIGYEATIAEHVAAWVIQGRMPFICLPITTASGVAAAKARVDEDVRVWHEFYAYLKANNADISRPVISTLPTRRGATSPQVLFYLNPDTPGLSNGADWTELLDYCVSACADVRGGLFGWGDGENSQDWDTSGIQDRIAEFNEAAEKVSRF